MYSRSKATLPKASIAMLPRPETVAVNETRDWGIQEVIRADGTNRILFKY